MTLQKDLQLKAREQGQHLDREVSTNQEDCADAIQVLFLLGLLLQAFSLIPVEDNTEIYQN